MIRAPSKECLVDGVVPYLRLLVQPLQVPVPLPSISVIQSVCCTFGLGGSSRIRMNLSAHEAHQGGYLRISSVMREDSQGAPVHVEPNLWRFGLLMQLQCTRVVV